MSPSATDTYLGLRAFVDELTRCGLREACTSPGSRSTPLVLSLVADARIRSTSHLDERSGAFYALGLAKASGRPVVLACTSGTAAANYTPAVIEAHEARVPLIVLTADRPPELRDIGAGQTIDQLKLYGSAAKWFFDLDDHPATVARLRFMRQLACRAYWTAIDGRPGPVHLNLALREPLVLDEPLPDDDPVPGREGRPPVADPAAAAGPPAAGIVDGLAHELRGRPARGARRGPRRARPGARRRPGRLRREGRHPAARGAAVGRPPRRRGDRPLRRAAAREGFAAARRRTSCCAWATCRPPSRCARGWPV
jgi:2-succinyl-5-enolpyruvyl-6-hydroxy-3-cyclohexene-1-carboxylate synthase